MTESNELQKKISLVDHVEGLLFVAPGPVTLPQIAASMEVSTADIEKAIEELIERYERSGGLYLQIHKGKYQLTTKPGLGAVIEKFLGLQATTRLSRAGLETLAIIAYKQPFTRPQLDDVRGVNSDGVLKSLLSKGLIEETGRADGPGRPIIYGTTSEFLQYFGLTSLENLPSLGINTENEAMEIQEKVFKD
jgi:segregation and condensation protein B